MSSISERLLEGRIKKFLMNSFESLGTHLKDADPIWTMRIENITMKAMINALEGMHSENPVKDAKLILQGLGFTPVEIRWHPDQGQGEIFLSISRIWKRPIESDQMLQTFVKGVCRGIGSLFFGPKTVVMVRLVDDREIPPRYRALFEFRPATKEEIEKEERLMAEKIQLDTRLDAQRESVDDSRPQNILMEIVGAVFSEMVPKEMMNELFVASLSWFAQQHLPHEWDALEPLLKRYPERALLRVYKEAQIRQSTDEWGTAIGTDLARRVQKTYPDLPPSQLIRGMSFLPLEKVASVLIYEPTEITHALTINNHLPVCNFLMHVWKGFISASLGTAFHLKELACGTNPTDACIYVYLKKE